MIDEYALIYIWITILLLWYGRNIKSETIDKPLLLTNRFFLSLFKLFIFVWITLSIYLLFNNWQVLLFTSPILILVGKFFDKVMWYLEGLALYPLIELYKRLVGEEVNNSETASVSVKNITLNQSTNKKDGWGLIDILFFVPLFISLYELFFYGLFAEELQTGFQGGTKPSWALATIFVVLLNPYKEIIYLWTIVFGIIWTIKSVYQLWKRTKK